MSVTHEQVVEALRPVEDPELHRSIVDIGMLRDVQINDGVVSILIALTVAGCPLRNEITNRVKNLVPYEFVSEAQALRIQDSVFVENHRVVKATSQREPSIPELFDFMHESERPRTADLLEVRRFRKIDDHGPDRTS